MDSLVPADILAAIECDDPTTPLEITSSPPDTGDGNTLSDISDAPEEFDDNIPTAETPSIITKTAMPLQQ